MKQFLLENKIATEDEITTIEDLAKEEARASKQRAWDNFISPIKAQVTQAVTLSNQAIYEAGSNAQIVAGIVQELAATREPIRKDVLQAVSKILALCNADGEGTRALRNFHDHILADNKEKFSSHLHSQSRHSAMKVTEIPADYDGDAPMLNGYEVLNKFFDHTLATNPAVLAFGEDLG